MGISITGARIYTHNYGSNKRNATQRAKRIREGKGRAYIETYRLTRETRSSGHNINNLRYIEEVDDAPWTTSEGSTT